MNGALDLVIGPLNMAARYFDDISKGIIPPKVTSGYSGEFNAIKQNLNTCIDSLNLLIEENEKMAKAQEADDSDYYMPVDKFHGVYRVLAEKGINAQVVAQAGIARQIVDIVGRFGDGDFSVGMPRLPGKQAVFRV